MPKKTASEPAEFPDLESAMDRESFEYLANNAPYILRALQAEVNRGRTPLEIELYISGEYARPEIAKRLKQAARHLLRAREA